MPAGAQMASNLVQPPPNAVRDLQSTLSPNVAPSPTRSAENGHPRLNMNENTNGTGTYSDARNSTIASRQRSVVRDTKEPAGPRPMDSTSKRNASGPNQATVLGNNRSYLPNSTSEPFLGLSARRGQNATELSREGSASDSSTSNPNTPRLPGSNTFASAKAPQPEDFPKPNTAKPPALFKTAAEPSRRSSSIGRHINLSRSSLEGKPSVRARPSASPVRSGQTALQAAQRSSAFLSNSPVVQPANTPRRQSQLPPSSPTKASRFQPRKSIGPGYTIPVAKERTIFDAASRTFVPDTREIPKGPMEIPGGRRTSQFSALSAQSGANATKGRDSRAAPSFPATTKQPSRPGSSSFGLVHGKSDTGSNRLANPPTFPPPSARRQSNAATYVGGLGARTISPTDVRRSRRMSVAVPHPAKQTESPSPELLLTQRPPPTPPATSWHKPGTPSSSRATPDVPQTSNAMRSAASSRSSYTSVRPMSSSSQHRPSGSLSHTGKPPASKSRPHHSSAGGEEELVPPVPAIPKAFESPTEVLDKPFFAPERTAHASISSHAASEEKDDEPFMTPEEQKPDPIAAVQDNRFGRRLTFAGGSDSQRDHYGLGASRQSSDASHLPPLNVLPLRTPTKFHIPSFAANAETSLPGPSAVTPPPPQGAYKMPTTPMTASKAEFGANSTQRAAGFPGTVPLIRSNTAAAGERTTSLFFDEPPNASPALFSSGQPSTPRHGPSPFGSFSLPRLNGELQHLPSRQPREDLPENVSMSKRSSNFLNRRPSTKAGKEQIQTTTLPNNAHEPEGPSSASSLRRKLSFGWKRSSSKASHASQHPDDETAFHASNEMPPPKLPASAMLSAAAKSPKLPPKPWASRAAETTDRSAQSRNSSATELPRPAAKSGTAERGVNGGKVNGSFFNVPRILAGRSSQSNLKNAQSERTVEDASADEEMRKLGARRKEFEVAAKELDDLRKRAQPKDRVSPSQASTAASLNIFERGEVIDYRDVYFCGTKGAAKIVGDLTAEGTNFGFDDERGDYKIVLGDHLAYRYEVVDVLGKGSFGQVVRCIDHKKGELVAIKIIRNKKRFHQQALVEVNILQKLREWDPKSAHSMISFTQSFYFRGHLCISTELLGMNLYEFIKAHDFTGFSLKLIRRFTKQMLSSLCLLQSRTVIHCDLKPENILLAHPLQSGIKVIDFGSSCFEHEKVYTYIQSRFYRSPEVILGMSYGMPIDMWSLGCILAELYTGYPIFPGENEQEQLACIMEVFGPPEKHLIERSTRKKLFFDSLGKPRITVSSKGKRRRPSSKTLTQALKCDDETFIDFVSQCLRWDPERRMKADEALQHEFVTGSKKNSRRQTTAPSSAKRITSQTPLKNKSGSVEGTSSKGRVTNGGGAGSPVKPGIGSRRKSGLYEQQNTSKSSMGGTASSSSLPRITQHGQRSASGKPDLASAAAIASLSSGPKRNA